MEVEQFLERIRIALKVWLPDLAKEEEEEKKKPGYRRLGY